VFALWTCPARDRAAAPADWAAVVVAAIVDSGHSSFTYPPVNEEDGEIGFRHKRKLEKSIDYYVHTRTLVSNRSETKPKRHGGALLKLTH
jgi:hypothetical protein